MKHHWYETSHRWRYLLIAIRRVSTPANVYRVARVLRLDNRNGNIRRDLVRYGIIPIEDF